MAVNGILLGQSNDNNTDISEQNFRSFTTAGSYSYIIPKTGWYYILMSGGGGGGSGGWPYRNTRSGKDSGGGNGGGAGSMFSTYDFFVKGLQLNLTVGKGGSGGSGGLGGRGSYGYANGASGSVGEQSTIGFNDYIAFQANGGGGAAPIFYTNTGGDTSPGSSDIGSGGTGTWVRSGTNLYTHASSGNGPILFPFNSALISKVFSINTYSSTGGTELNDNIGGGGGGGNSWLAPGGNGGDATTNTTRNTSTDGKDGQFGSGGGGGGQADGSDTQNSQGGNGGNGGDGFIIIVSL